MSKSLKQPNIRTVGNYYLVRRDRQGFFVPVMGFVSDDAAPIVRERHPRFEDIIEALQYADDDTTEYGVQIHQECYEPDPPTLTFVEEKGHYYGCSQASTAEKIREEYPDCVCEVIVGEWNKQYLPSAAPIKTPILPVVPFQESNP